MSRRATLGHSQRLPIDVVAGSATPRHVVAAAAAAARLPSR
jgi:hypothetical protein